MALFSCKNSYKIVVIGDSSVGKTCIVNTLVSNEPMMTSTPTIGLAFFTKVYKTNPQSRLEIWDTAGQERFRSIACNYFRGAEGCIIIFDVKARESFDNIEYWIDEYKRYCTDPYVIMIVANKTDNPVDTWAVNVAEINNIVDEHNASLHYTSVTKPETIDTLFSTCLDKLIAKRKELIGKFHDNIIKVEQPPESIMSNCMC